MGKNLLRWVDGIVEDASKRLGDGDVFNDKDDGNGRKLGKNQAYKIAIQGWDSGVFKALSILGEKTVPLKHRLGHSPDWIWPTM